MQNQQDVNVCCLLAEDVECGQGAITPWIWEGNSIWTKGGNSMPYQTMALADWAFVDNCAVVTAIKVRLWEIFQLTGLAQMQGSCNKLLHLRCLFLHSCWNLNRFPSLTSNPVMVLAIAGKAQHQQLWSVMHSESSLLFFIPRRGNHYGWRWMVAEGRAEHKLTALQHMTVESMEPFCPLVVKKLHYMPRACCLTRQFCNIWLVQSKLNN